VLRWELAWLLAAAVFAVPIAGGETGFSGPAGEASPDGGTDDALGAP
jgi:hypothetical protein